MNRTALTFDMMILFCCVVLSMHESFDLSFAEHKEDWGPLERLSQQQNC